MKLEQKATPVEVNGGSTHSSFSIAMNGKAFRVLSDTLYQNKIGSIVRELSCNAHDAHVMAGKTEVPFVLHLPDAFEPWFSVQDQGVGLSPEDIASVFTVYFQSTKEQSNDTIGAFGLGAKTPFSYTDQFTVTSVKNGLRTIYNAFINEQGIPNIVEMFSEETTEGNGVEIKLSVKREDYSKFASEVKNQLQYFKVKPMLLNTENNLFEEQPTEVLFDTPAVSVEKYTGYGSGTRVALQGNVGYTLDMNQLSGKISAESYQLLYTLSSVKTVLKFNIGEIGVTASREGVEYTATTLKNICNKITEAKKQISDIIEDKMTKEFTTDYQRLAYLNGNQIARSFVTTLKVPNAESDSVRWLFNMQKHLIVNNQSSGMITLVGRNSRTKASLKHMAYKFTPTTENNQVILFKDKSTLSAKKIQHFFLTNPKVNSVYVVEFFDKVYNKTKKDELQKFLGGFDNIQNMSDIILPVAVREKQKSQSKIPKYYAHCGLTNYSEVRNYIKEFTDLSEIKVPTVYFVVEHLNPTCDLTLIGDLQDLSSLTKVLPVIAVRESAVEKLEKNPLFIPLSKYIQDKKKELGTDEVKRKLNRKYILDSVLTNISYSLTNKKELIIKNCPDNEISRLFNTLDVQKNVTKDTSIVMNRFLRHHPSTDGVVRAKVAKVTTVVKNILNKYAVIHTLGNTYHGKEISDQHLITYLNAVQSYLQK